MEKLKIKKIKFFDHHINDRHTHSRDRLNTTIRTHKTSMPSPRSTCPSSHINHTQSVKRTDNIDKHQQVQTHSQRERRQPSSPHANQQTKPNQQTHIPSHSRNVPIHFPPTISLVECSLPIPTQPSPHPSTSHPPTHHPPRGVTHTHTHTHTHTQFEECSGPIPTNIPPHPP
jgi:hypothetical protein